MEITENKLQLCLEAFSFKGAISQYPRDVGDDRQD